MGTNLIDATLRVSSIDGSPATRPEPQRVQQAARALEGLGFDVVRIGRFGVRVRAEPDRFEQTLGVSSARMAGGSMPVSPMADSLSGLIDYVEVLPPPNSAEG